MARFVRWRRTNRKGNEPWYARTVRRFVPLLASVAVLACAAEPKVTPIVGPDGSRMFHVSCGGQEARCYELAGERCPNGYEFGRTIRERGSLLVRCRMPGEGTQSSGWVPMVDLAPTPYGAPSPSGKPYVTPVPVTTAPAGYPPLGPGAPPAKNDIGY